MTPNSESILVLQISLELPCGAILKNRFAKSPMSDSLADGGGIPPRRRFDFTKDGRKVESLCPSSVKYKGILAFRRGREIFTRSALQSKFTKVIHQPGSD
jgi:hypothetical protein